MAHREEAQDWAAAMSNWVFGIDVWEGNLDIDEAELLRGGVDFIIPRLNSIQGTLHKDFNFDAQWEQAKGFIRFPYFVYTPYARGTENYEWMAANLPPGVKRVAVDVEVIRSGYSPTEYAANVKTFIDLCFTHGLWPVIYTGGWFIKNLSVWPKTEYWWARYPYVMYPSQSRQVTWGELKEMLSSLAWNPACTLGPCRLWQCSGDRLKLPGCNNRAVDINIWNGNRDELEEWVGYKSSPPASWAQSLTDWARSQPQPYTGPDPESIWMGSSD